MLGCNHGCFHFMTKTSKIFLTLIALDVLFVILHLLFGKELSLFNLDKERTFSSYFDGMRLVIVAGFAAGIAMMALRRSEKISWLLFALLFVYLGFDDISELHENIAYYLNKLITPLSFFRSPTYMWLAFLSPFIVGAICYLSFFIKNLSSDEGLSKKLMTSGLALFVGALAMEFSSGLIHSKAFLRVEVVIEEGLEKLGATLFLLAVLLLFEKRFALLFQRMRQQT